MRVKQETHFDSRRNVGVGAAIGVLLGAALADLIIDSSLAGVMGMAVGAALGAALGARYHQVHWMEYPAEVIRRLIISGAIFFTVLLLAVYLNGDEIEQPLQVLLALAPLIPGLFFVVSVGDAITKLDDLQQKIQVEAIAIGYGITLLITMTVGLLAQAGVRQANWLLVTLVMLFAWLIGKLWLRWKYR